MLWQASARATMPTTVPIASACLRQQAKGTGHLSDSIRQLSPSSGLPHDSRYQASRLLTQQSPASLRNLHFGWGPVRRPAAGSAEHQARLKRLSLAHANCCSWPPSAPPTATATATTTTTTTGSAPRQTASHKEPALSDGHNPCYLSMILRHLSRPAGSTRRSVASIQALKACCAMSLAGRLTQDDVVFV